MQVGYACPLTGHEGGLATLAGVDTLSPYFGWVGPFFQAPARALIAAWLWRSSSAVG